MNKGKETSKKLIIWLLVLLFLPFTQSCEDEVDAFVEGDPVAIVYCLLNPFDSVQYVRINRTYLSEEGTEGFPSTSDSIYFMEDIQVSIERWEDNEVKETIIFEKYEGKPKDSGNFPNDKSILYRAEGKIYTQSKYILYLYMTESENIIQAEATTIGDLVIIDPFPIPERKVTLSSIQDYTIRWDLSPEAWIYQTAVRFNYDEINGEDTLRKSFDWMLNISQPDFQKREYVSARINGSKFFQILVQNIEENTSVKRKAVDLDFIFYYGGVELRFYVESISPSTTVLQEKPSFTNFTNAEGIFSSLAKKEILSIQLSNIMIDSIAHSSVSRNLSFVDHLDSLYIK
ncbi:hypothetical protein ACFLSY_03335 [Bacteroidota bacterium]